VNVDLADVHLVGVIVRRGMAVVADVRPARSVREIDVSECFDAFYDSYYRGGENGKGSEWKEFYDGQRCHQLAANILSVCRDGLNGDAPPSSTTPPTTGQTFCGGIREKASTLVQFFPDGSSLMVHSWAVMSVKRSNGRSVWRFARLIRCGL